VEIRVHRVEKKGSVDERREEEEESYEIPRTLPARNEQGLDGSNTWDHKRLEWGNATHMRNSADLRRENATRPTRARPCRGTVSRSNTAL